MRSSWRTIWVSMAMGAVVLTLGALSSACGAAESLKIGVVNEVTGPQAEAGQFTVNGIKLAQDEINKPAACSAVRSICASKTMAAPTREPCLPFPS